AASQQNVSRVSVSNGAIQTANVSQNAGGSVKARAFSSAGGPVHLACDRGVLEWSAQIPSAFVNRQTIGPSDDLFAVAETSGPLGLLLAGGAGLERLAPPPAVARDIFLMGDDKIRALAMERTATDTIAWIGSDTFGLAGYSRTADRLIDHLTTDTAAP